MWQEWMKEYDETIKETEEIKVGEYVRTKRGSIEKVKTVNKYCSITYKTLVSARVEEKINWYSESGREIEEEDILKHSPNIIDLLEERRLCKWL